MTQTNLIRQSLKSVVTQIKNTQRNEACQSVGSDSVNGVVADV